MEAQIDFEKINLQDALDLAIFVEEEAKERYVELAEQVGSKHDGDASSFFISMAEHEAKQEQELKAKREKFFGHTPPKVDPSLIEAFRGAEAPEYDRIRPFMSTRHALAVALASEMKACHFYDQALEHVTNEEVKQFFTELRAEEIRQQDLIKDLLRKNHEGFSPEVDPDDVDVPELD